MPPTVLPADTAIGSDGLKTHGVVQADACVIRERHARDGGAEAALGPQVVALRSVQGASPSMGQDSKAGARADRAGGARAG